MPTQINFAWAFLFLDLKMLLATTYQPTTNDPAITAPAANVRRPGDFPPEEFVHIPDVPVFEEHKTTARNGQPLAFGYHELNAVVARCNRRITETGDYAAVCIGHTPSPEAVDSGTAIMPEIVGFAGPWKIGTTGFTGQRRWTILADFWIFRADIAKFKKHPRRSAELWLEDKYEEMFLDPIALLGAETPRLDMGLLYSAVRSGTRRTVEKYAAVAPAAGNVFIPDAGGDRRKYSSLGAPSMALAPEDVGQIVEALMQTEPMQFLMSMMSQQGAAGGEAPGAVPDPGAPAPAAPPAAGVVPPHPPAAPPAAAPSPAAHAPPPAAPPKPAGPPGAPPGAPPGGPPEAKKPGEPEKNMADGTAPTFSPQTTVDKKAPVQYAAGDEMPEEERKEREQYAALCKKYAAGSAVPADGAEAKGGPPSVENAEGNEPTGGSVIDDEKLKYSRVQRQLAETAGQVAQLNAQLQTERGARINAERYSKLSQLHAAGYSFDLEKNRERVLYSKMSDAVFEGHLETLMETSAQAPIDRELVVYGTDAIPGSGNGGVTVGEDGRRERAKYSKAHSDKALRHCMALQEKGESPDYETILEQVAAGKI